LSLAGEFKNGTKRLAEDTDYATHDEIADELGAKQIHYDIIDTVRWGQVVEYVYMKGLEYARVVYTEGSGDSEYDYEPEWTAVRPVTKTVITYENL